MDSQDLKETTRGADVKPDEGFAYNPGKAGLDAWQPDMAKYSVEEQDLMNTVLSRGPAVERV